MSLTKFRLIALSFVVSVFFVPQGQAADVPVYSDTDLLALASAHGVDDLHNLMLGDRHYTLDAPHKGYIYLCHVPHGGGGGAQADGPWIHGATWNPDERIFVSGEQVWSDAFFTMNRSQGARLFSGNGLPITHPTGFFPIQTTDPAFRYDHNPNRIQAQTYNQSISLDPVYNDEPTCMGMEAGVMLTGVPLFNGFDAELRDAAAHEIQDKCSGHPQQSGKYHYHSLSRCIANTDTHTVIGYALDGFPITGGQVMPGKFLMTSDLDVCHGIVSELNLDGQKKISYHYVMTPDFPYSVSCFRAHPTSTQPEGGQRAADFQQGNPGGPPIGRHPPQEAVDACAGTTEGNVCGFIAPRGERIEGSCRTVIDGALACVPQR